MLLVGWYRCGRLPEAIGAGAKPYSPLRRSRPVGSPVINRRQAALRPSTREELRDEPGLRCHIDVDVAGGELYVLPLLSRVSLASFTVSLQEVTQQPVVQVSPVCRLG